MNYIEKLPGVWQNYWREFGFDEPSLIQEQSFDLLKDNNNVLGVSPTGSGKTLAYLLPLLLKVQKNAGNQLLILLSSQELALQVGNTAREWAKLLGLKTQTIIGGANTTRQIEKLKQRPEVIIGTPGRVLELIRAKKIQIMNLEAIVFDEADSLIEGNGASIAEKIVGFAPKDYQLAFFSATAQKVKDEAEKIAGEDLFMIDVSEEDRSRGKMEHEYMNVPTRKKIEVLRGLVHVENFQAICFFNQVGDLGNAEEKLLFHHLPIASLASDQDKLVRKTALEKFKNGEIKLLLTTDVLARGIDLKNLPYVVNMDVPLTLESYTHRSGRVGRMGADGKVITLIQDNTKKDYAKLMKAQELKSEEVFLWGASLVKEVPKVEFTPNVKKERTTTTSKEILEKTVKVKSKVKKKNRKNKGAPKWAKKE